jgi:aminoglycoside 3-N-acetyltransferase
VENGAPVLVDGRRVWTAVRQLDLDDSDFEAIGDEFERSTGHVRRGRVADATALLMPQRSLVDFAVQWMEAHRCPRPAPVPS